MHDLSASGGDRSFQSVTEGYDEKAADPPLSDLYRQHLSYAGPYLPFLIPKMTRQVIDSYRSVFGIYRK